MSSTHHTNYVKVWAILLVLLLISITGPMLEIPIVTLITAFGIAGVKAYLVITRFMHLNAEKPIILMLFGTCLALLLLFFAGTGPDVMNHEGSNWTNDAAHKITHEAELRAKEQAESGSHH